MTKLKKSEYTQLKIDNNRTRKKCSGCGKAIRGFKNVCCSWYNHPSQQGYKVVVCVQCCRPHTKPKGLGGGYILDGM